MTIIGGTILLRLHLNHQYTTRVAAPTRIVAWISRHQEPLLRDLLKCGNIQLVAAGSPDHGLDGELLAQTDAERIDDLRRGIQRDDVDLVVHLASQPIEEDVRRLIVETSMRTMTIEPLFGTIAEAIGEPIPIGLPLFSPPARRSPGFRAAQDVLVQLGDVQCVSIFFRCGVGQGTLFSRLFDAMDLLQHLCGPVESINASLSGPLERVPEDLHLLEGHMTINVRFKPNRCACIALSNHAGSWFRGITVLGDGGCLRISDPGFEWIGRDGALLDRHDEAMVLTPGMLVADQISRLLDDREHAQASPHDHVNVLTLCEAARLSCLTGQDEAPGKLMELLSKP
jgi:hypothetical protein